MNICAMKNGSNMIVHGVHVWTGAHEDVSST